MSTDAAVSAEAASAPSLPTAAAPAPASDPASASIPDAALAPAAAAAAEAEEDLVEMPLVAIQVEVPGVKQPVLVHLPLTDPVMEIRYQLVEHPSTCELTRYILELDGAPVNEFLSVNAFPSLTRCLTTGKPHTMRVVPDVYDEAAAREHVRRVREILANPPISKLNTPSPLDAALRFAEPVPAATSFAATLAASSAVAAPSSSKASSKRPRATPSTAPCAPIALLATTALSPFPSASSSSSPSPSSSGPLPCLSHIAFSAFNPVSSARAVKGDLFYLEIGTLDGTGRTLHVTATASGFFVNASSSSTFDPRPATHPCRAHTLVELLKKASPRFASSYPQLFSRPVHRLPLDAVSIPAAFEAKPWAVPETEHVADWNRAEDALTRIYGADPQAAQREWNDDFQNARDCPSATPQDRAVRDRALHQVYTDFVEAATKGAVAVVEGNVQPMNAMEAPRAHIFVSNNIFYSFAVDARGVLAKEGGDAAAHVNAKLGLLASGMLTQLDLPGVHFLACAVIDYRGHRVVAESLVPGIFLTDRSSVPIYGSLDQGLTFVGPSATLRPVLVDLARRLHLTGRKITFQGKEHDLPLSSELKGVRGSDGRSYLMDLHHLHPRDPRFPDPAAHPGAFFRPELVSAYCAHRAATATSALFDEEIAAANSAAAAAAAKAKAAAEQAGAEHDAGAAQAALEAMASAIAERQSRLTSARQAYKTALQEHAFNTDVLLPSLFPTAGASDSPASSSSSSSSSSPSAPPVESKMIESETGLADLKQLAAFLTETVIPAFVRDLKSAELCPSDPASLVALMHTRGISSRDLHTVATLAAKEGLHFVVDLAHIEMLARAAQPILEAQLRMVRPEPGQKPEYVTIAACVSRFLSSLLGAHCGGQGLSPEALTAGVAAAERISVRDAEMERKLLADSLALAAALGEELPPESEALLTSGKTVAAVERVAAAEKEAVAAAAAHSANGSNGSGRKKASSSSSSSSSSASSRRAAVQQRAHLHQDDRMAPATLWGQLLRGLERQFGWVPADRQLALSAAHKTLLLRSLCLKTGVQVLARNYDYDGTASSTASSSSSSSSPLFTEDDIMGVQPVVHCVVPPRRDAAGQLTLAKRLLSQGAIEMAFAHAQEAIQLYLQAGLAISTELADCFRTLALICHHGNDPALAVEAQYRSLCMCKRVHGADHPETAHAHALLALFLLCNNPPAATAALNHAERAVYLLELTAGPNHVETAAALVNKAVVLHDAGCKAEAVDVLQEAVKRMAAAVGPSHLQTAFVRHALASTYVSTLSYKLALGEALALPPLFTAHFGSAEHPRVKEVQSWVQAVRQWATRAKQAGIDPLGLLAPIAQASGEVSAALELVSAPLAAASRLSQPGPSWTRLKSSRYDRAVSVGDLLQLVTEGVEGEEVVEGEKEKLEEGEEAQQHGDVDGVTATGATSAGATLAGAPRGKYVPYQLGALNVIPRQVLPADAQALLTQLEAAQREQEAVRREQEAVRLTRLQVEKARRERKQQHQQQQLQQQQQEQA